MESGYKILWTNHALNELKKTYEYLEENFADKELRKLSSEIDKTLNLICTNPNIFPKSEYNGVRRVVIKKFSTLYYREKNNQIEILSFFSNRQNPTKRDI